MAESDRDRFDPRAGRPSRGASAPGRSYLLEAAAWRHPSASVVAEAADLTGERMLEALDRGRAVEAGAPIVGGIRGPLHVHARPGPRHRLRRAAGSRRVRYRHRIAVATEAAHKGDVGPTSANWRSISTWAPSWRCRQGAAATARPPVRAMRLLAFEESAVHYTRALEVLDRFGPKDPGTRWTCSWALAGAEARAGVHRHADECLTQAAEAGAPHGRRSAPDPSSA